MRIAIFGGSFNPIHIGHTRLAEYIVSNHDCGVDELWLMVTPRNPLKPAVAMASNSDRLNMARLACRDIAGVRASDFEMQLPAPWYSIRTLTALAEQYPADNFRLVIGADNWLLMDKWKSPEEIVQNFCPIIYPRPGYDIDADNLPEHVTYLPQAPLTDVSSTQIREAIIAEKEIDNMLPTGVGEYIRAHGIYK